MPADDFVTSLLGNPATIAGLSVLADPTRPAQGLLAGISRNLANQRATLLNELRRREIARAIFNAQQREQAAAGRGQVRTALADPSLTRDQLISQVGQAPGFEEVGLTARLAQTGANIGAVSPNNFTPESVARFAQTNNFADLVPVQKAPLVQNIVGQNAFKTPAGFMLADPNDPSAGVKPIPGGPVGRQSPEQAAKTALLTGAKENISLIRESIIPGGKVDRVLIGTLTGNVPFSQGRLTRQRVMDTIEAKLRLETGAQAPESEVERLSARFLPSPLDSDESVADKINRLEKFLDQSLKQTAPEVLKRLQSGDTKTEFKETKRIGGRTFVKDKSGQWFEVTQ